MNMSTAFTFEKKTADVRTSFIFYVEILIKSRYI